MSSTESQQELLEDSPCRCEVRHALTHEEQERAMRLVRSNRVAYQQIGHLMLRPCPCQSELTNKEG